MTAVSKRRYGLGTLAIIAGTTLALGGWTNPPEHAAPDTHAPAAKPAAPAVKPAATAASKPTAPPPPPAVKPAVKPAPAPAAVETDDTTPDADGAYKLLQEGNQRWLASAGSDPNTSAARRQAVAAGQHPFATILTCADSRIPVERVFDRGVGDLFVVRVAGNLIGPHEAGTIEYGAAHLNVPLLVVMGHTKCGAVGAAASHGHTDGNITSLIQAIEPAVARAEKLNPGLKDAELAAAAVKENVWQSIFDLLKTSDTCRQLVAKGELRIIGAVYDVGSGGVEWLGEHPWQSELITAFTPGRTGQETATAAEAPAADNHDAH